MGVTYYKRFRMEIDLGRLPPVPGLPLGYHWVPWHTAMCDYHAEVKYRCFVAELDSKIFPCLGDRHGCEQLMREISRRSGFLPEATWLVGDSSGYVGTVQGLRDRSGHGMIQNLGVVPEARRQGLGAALLLKALHGFRQVGLRFGTLEVTASNLAAIRLYRAVGFHRARVLYKAVASA